MMILPTGDVHLWCVYNEKITNPELLTQYYNLLHEGERLQKERFYFEKHRNQYLITRAMVRATLSLYENSILPQNWIFKKNNYGKPYIANLELSIPLHFNLSHTDGLIVMVVTRGQEVGVDVECLSRGRNMLDVARKIFSPVEIMQLQQLPQEKKMDRFFELWTLKEAYVKACGMGLSIPFDQFSYIFSPEDKVAIHFSAERNDQADFWRFWRIFPNSDYKVSIAIKGLTPNEKFSISIRDIVPLVNIKEVHYPVI